MAVMFDPQRRWDERLEEASRYLGVGSDDVVSIKVRPIQAVGDMSDADAYVYPDEYAEILASLDGFPLVSSGYGMAGQYRLYRLEGDIPLLFVEHETGPELIFALHLIRDASIATGAAAAAGVQIVKLINVIRSTIAAGTAKKKTGKASQRYYVAEKVSLEKRLKAGAKILKQVAAVATKGEKLITKIEEIGR